MPYLLPGHGGITASHAGLHWSRAGCSAGPRYLCKHTLKRALTSPANRAGLDTIDLNRATRPSAPRALGPWHPTQPVSVALVLSACGWVQTRPPCSRTFLAHDKPMVRRCHEQRRTRGAGCHRGLGAVAGAAALHVGRHEVASAATAAPPPQVRRPDRRGHLQPVSQHPYRCLHLSSTMVMQRDWQV